MKKFTIYPIVVLFFFLTIAGIQYFIKINSKSDPWGKDLKEFQEVSFKLSGTGKGVFYKGMQVAPSDVASKANVPFMRQIPCYEKAQNGDVESQYELGMLYRNGIALDDVCWDKNPSEGIKWIRKAANQGSFKAQRELGNMYILGEGVPKDLSEGIKCIRKVAEHGDAKAQYELSMMYGKGLGVPKDDSEMTKWLEKSVDQNYPTAQYTAGMMLYKDASNQEQAATGIKMMMLAAQNGDAQAQYCVGFLSKDDAITANWYHKAADQGLPQAQRAFAACLVNGVGGLTQNNDTAIKWYLKAAAQGYDLAQYELGTVLNKMGNESEAAKWWLAAAKQGNIEAQMLVISCYLAGKGLPKDFVEALAWNYLAANFGNELAIKSVPIMEKEIGVEMATKAQQRSKELSKIVEKNKNQAQFQLDFAFAQ